MLDFSQVLASLVGLFLLIVVGYLAARFKVLSPAISPQLSQFLLKITLPCTIFSSLLRSYEPDFLTDILTVLVIVLLLLLLCSLFSRFLARLIGIPLGKRGIWAFCATFSNFGFMGFPILLALFGEDGLALGAIFSLACNLLLYSVGTQMICVDCKHENAQKEKVRWRSVLLTNVNLGTALGLIFYFFQLSLPDMIMTPVTHLANITTPLSMVLIGINISDSAASTSFLDKSVLTATVARLVVTPLFSYAILHGIDAVFHLSNPLILPVVLVLMSMPAPAVAGILAQSYHSDHLFASKVVLLSSLLCILTIPLMTFLL